MTHVNPNVVQVAYRFRNDNGSETAATWRQAQNTADSIDVDTTFRLRLEVEENAGAAGSAGGQLEVARNGGAFQSVTTTSTIVKAVTGTVADGTATTNQLTAGAGTFVAGTVSNDGLAASVSLTSQHTEFEYALQIVSADVVNGDTITFRVAGLNLWSQTASATVVEAATPMALENTAEGGSHGTTVTTGNSGGGSGDAWSSVTISGNGTLTFDNSFPAAGSLGYKIVRPTDATSAPEARWDFSDDTEFYGRFYVHLVTSSYPSSLRLCLIASSTGTRRAELNLNSTGNLRVVNSANSVIATSTNAVATDQLIRVEFHFVGNATTGRMETKYFQGHSTTAVQELAMATNMDTAGAAGRYLAISGGSSSDGYVWHIDAIKLAESDWIGPAASSAAEPRHQRTVLSQAVKHASTW